MGEFVAAGLLSHVPTIMLPEATRRELGLVLRYPSFREGVEALLTG